MKKPQEPIMKCIVETTGNFMLLNSTMEEVNSIRPCVTTQTPFIDIRINKKELKVLARNLPKQADDADFKEVYTEMKKNGKAATEAYCAELGVNIDGEVRDDLVEEDKEETKEEAESLKTKEEDANSKGDSDEDTKSTTGDTKGNDETKSEPNAKVPSKGKSKNKSKK